MGFIEQKAKDLGIETAFTYIDTFPMAKTMLPDIGRYKLDNVAKELKVPIDDHPWTGTDAERTANVFLKLTEMLKEK